MTLLVRLSLDVVDIVLTVDGQSSLNRWNLCIAHFCYFLSAFRLNQGDLGLRFCGCQMMGLGGCVRATDTGGTSPSAAARTGSVESYAATGCTGCGRRRRRWRRYWVKSGNCGNSSCCLQKRLICI